MPVSRNKNSIKRFSSTFCKIVLATTHVFKFETEHGAYPPLSPNLAFSSFKENFESSPINCIPRLTQISVPNLPPRLRLANIKNRTVRSQNLDSFLITVTMITMKKMTVIML